MSDEIKEIVDDLIKNRDKLVRGFYFPEDLLGTLDLIKLIDYITNLQNENERLRTVLNGSEEKRKKAIEYITNNKLYTFKYDDEELFEITTDKIAKDNLLKILGGDEE